MQKQLALALALAAITLGLIALRSQTSGADVNLRDTGRGAEAAASGVDREPLAAVTSPALGDEAGSGRALATAPPSQGAPPLVAKVINADGTPVDRFWVRVGVFPRGDPDHEALTGMTDGAGEVRFTAADVQRVQSQAPGALLRVELSSDTHAPVIEELEPGVIPEEPVVLRVDMVRLVVSAVTSTGESWTRRAGLLVRPAGFHYYCLRGQTPLIGWVPHGTGYELKVYRCGAHGDGRESFPVPRAELREIAHTITLGPPVPMITGQIIGPDGELLAEGTQVEALDRGRTGNGSRWFRTGPEGRFEYALRLGEAAGQRKVFEFGLLDRGPDSPHGAATSRVRFTVPSPREPLDLGVLTLVPRPLLVAGRLVLPEGIRARGIGISPMAWISDGWRRHPEFDNCRFVDEEGRFRLHGEDLPGPETLDIEDGFREDVQDLVPAVDLRFEPGTEGMEIPLVRPGTVRAELGDGFRRRSGSSWFTWSVRPRGGGAPVVRRETRTANSILEFKRVPPGTACIELLDGPRGAPVAAWGGVVVRSGEVTRLGPLALPVDTARIELQVRVPESAKPSVRYGPAGSRPLEHEARGDGGGRFLLVRGDGPLDVLAYGTGLAPRLLEGVVGDLEVTLDRGAVVVVDVDGYDELRQALGDAASDRALRLLFTPADDEAERLLTPVDVRGLETQRMLSLSQPLPEAWSHVLRWPGSCTVRAELAPFIDAASGRPSRDPLTPAVDLGILSIPAGPGDSRMDLDLSELTRMGKDMLAGHAQDR